MTDDDYEGDHEFRGSGGGLFRGRMRGQQPDSVARMPKPKPKPLPKPVAKIGPLKPKVDAADSAIHVLMNDTRAGDAKGGRDRFMEFVRRVSGRQPKAK